MADRELNALLDEIREAYRPGALEAMAAADPEWRRALERTEREAGVLYEALGEADTTVARWHRAIGELRALWRRVDEARAGAGSLAEVA